MSIVRDLSKGFSVITDIAAVVIMSEAPHGAGTIHGSGINFSGPRIPAWSHDRVAGDQDRCIRISHGIEPGVVIGVAPLVQRVWRLPNKSIFRGVHEIVWITNN